MRKRPRICIDARLDSGLSGGVEQFIIGLAQGMSSLTDGDEEYYFLTYPEADTWLIPYIDGPCNILHTKRSRHYSWKRKVASNLPHVRKIIEKLASLAAGQAINIPVSNGTIEQAGIDLMHFTFQSAFLTDVPNIYHPHDLQHIHFPEYFSEFERQRRTILYNRFAQQARMVLASSSWVAQDLEDHLNIGPERIGVVPLAPPTEAYPVPPPESLASVKKKFNLPEVFAFYPAQTWPHKNHLSLIHAVANLRDNFNLYIPLVFSGHKNDYYCVLQNQVKDLDLVEQVHFLGFITTMELQSLYRLCRCVIIPTQFEAASFPLWEAFLAGAPTACSNVTSLARQAGNSALIFNPNDRNEILNCLYRLWNEGELRKSLVVHARENVNRFTWKKTSLSFRAHYRCILGLELTSEDNDILNAEPML
jgi:glycosyltransferase involved in cell wall biosynthesis